MNEIFKLSNKLYYRCGFLCVYVCVCVIVYWTQQKVTKFKKRKRKYIQITISIIPRSSSCRANNWVMYV